MAEFLYVLYFFNINYILIILIMITIELDIRERELIEKMPIHMKNLNLEIQTYHHGFLILFRRTKITYT